MNKTEIERVQAYMRRLFGSTRIRVVPPPRPGLSVEVAVDDEVIGTVYRDTDDGEVSYSVHLTILEEDLPPATAPAAPAAPAKGRPSR
jgi:Protein of unknown function (DUF3126)